jgi:hypothetical protein
MKDTLNKLDPLLLTLGDVIRPKPISDADIKQQALYRFERVCHDPSPTFTATLVYPAPKPEQPKADADGWIAYKPGDAMPNVRMEIRCADGYVDSVLFSEDLPQDWLDGTCRNRDDVIVAYRVL